MCCLALINLRNYDICSRCRNPALFTSSGHGSDRQCLPLPVPLGQSTGLFRCLAEVLQLRRFSRLIDADALDFVCTESATLVPVFFEFTLRTSRAFGWRLFVLGIPGAAPYMSSGKNHFCRMFYSAKIPSTQIAVSRFVFISPHIRSSHIISSPACSVYPVGCSQLLLRSHQH